MTASARCRSELSDLIWVKGNEVRESARVRIADIHVDPTFRRRVQRTVATLTDETGTAQETVSGGAISSAG